MEEFKLLQAQETRGLLLCFLTHNTAFKVGSFHHMPSESQAVYFVLGRVAHVYVQDYKKVSMKTDNEC